MLFGCGQTRLHLFTGLAQVGARFFFGTLDITIGCSPLPAALKLHWSRLGLWLAWPLHVTLPQWPSLALGGLLGLSAVLAASCFT
jgi:hypothetical protein